MERARDVNVCIRYFQTLSPRTMKDTVLPYLKTLRSSDITHNKDEWDTLRLRLATMYRHRFRTDVNSVHFLHDFISDLEKIPV